MHIQRNAQLWRLNCAWLKPASAPRHQDLLHLSAQPQIWRHMMAAPLCTLCSPADGGLRQLQVEVQKGGESLQHRPASAPH
jgi:hypothetical protein